MSRSAAAAPHHHPSAQDRHDKQPEAASRVDHFKHTVPNHFAKAAAPPQKPLALPECSPGLALLHKLSMHFWNTLYQAMHR